MTYNAGQVSDRIAAAIVIWDQVTAHLHRIDDMEPEDQTDAIYMQLNMRLQTQGIGEFRHEIATIAIAAEDAWDKLSDGYDACGDSWLYEADYLPWFVFNCVIASDSGSLPLEIRKDVHHAVDTEFRRIRAEQANVIDGVVVSA